MLVGDSIMEAWFGMSRASLVARLRSLANDLENVEKPADMLPPSVAINSWALWERRVPCLIGRPIGHPMIGDDKASLSSELFYLDPERGIARTMSRWYRLGSRVDPGYWAARNAELGTRLKMP